MIIATSEPRGSSRGEHPPGETESLQSVVAGQTRWVTDVGMMTGLFETIADAGPTGITPVALARRLGYAPDHVERWCRAAFALDLIDGDDGGGFRLAASPGAVQIAPAVSPARNGARFVPASWADPDSGAFRWNGDQPRPQGALAPQVIQVLRHLCTVEAPAVTGSVPQQVPTLLARLEAGGRILDAGPGTGVRLIHYATRFPHAHVVGLEDDSTRAEYVRDALASAGLAGRAEVRQGAAHELTDPAGYDLIVVGLALDLPGGPVGFRNVLERVRGALRPGGVTVISALSAPPSPGEYRTSLAYRLLAVAQLQDPRIGCGLLSSTRLCSLATETGLVNPRIIDPQPPHRLGLIAERSRSAPR